MRPFKKQVRRTFRVQGRNRAATEVRRSKNTMAKKLGQPLPALNPLLVPAEWHRYLYCSILLPWETSLKQRKNYRRFNSKNPIAGITLCKRGSAEEVAQDLERYTRGPRKSSSLTFHGSDAALKDLLRLLRNCVAHGHYAQSDRIRIHFKHLHHGKLNLFGTLCFAELKALVTYIQDDKELSTANP